MEKNFKRTGVWDFGKGQCGVCSTEIVKTGNRQRYCSLCSKRQKRLLSYDWLLRVKIAVLTYYGKNGRLQCCWRGCTISDVDCLTLDHVEDNGKRHREKGFPTGAVGMSKLLNSGFPDGYQTLCGGHQWKKEIIRRRKNRRIK